MLKTNKKSYSLQTIPNHLNNEQTSCIWTATEHFICSLIRISQGWSWNTNISIRLQFSRSRAILLFRMIHRVAIKRVNETFFGFCLWYINVSRGKQKTDEFAENGLERDLIFSQNIFLFVVLRHNFSLVYSFRFVWMSNKTDFHQIFALTSLTTFQFSIKQSTNFVQLNNNNSKSICYVLNRTISFTKWK